MSLSTTISRRYLVAMLVIALALVVSIAGFYWYRDRAQVADSDATTEAHSPDNETLISNAPPDMPVAGKEGNLDGLAVPVPKPMPLPDAALPLAEQLEALESLAEAGDPEATCRLHVGVRRCRMVTQRLRRAEQMQASLERGDNVRINEDLMLMSIANALEQTHALASWCEGVQPIGLPDTDTLVERNIERMSTRQKVLLAMTRQDGSIIRMPRYLGSPGGLGGNTDFSYPQFLSDRAYAILQEGIQHADPLALEGMIMVHSPSWIPGIEEFPRLSLPNRREFVRHALLMERLYGEDQVGTVVQAALVRNLALMSSAEREEAQRWVERESERWLATASATAVPGGEVTAAPDGFERDCSDRP